MLVFVVSGCQQPLVDTLGAPTITSDDVDDATTSGVGIFGTLADPLSAVEARESLLGIAVAFSIDKSPSQGPVTDSRSHFDSATGSSARIEITRSAAGNNDFPSIRRQRSHRKHPIDLEYVVHGSAVR